MLGMTDKKRKVGGSIAAVALVGSLSVGMVSMQARPAEALLPVIPAVVLGGVGAATGVSVAGIATAAGVTAAVVGLAFAIQQPGAFDWMKDIPDWFAPNTDSNGTPVETKKETEYVPIPSREGDADPLFYDYVWKSPTLTSGQPFYFAPTNGTPHVVKFPYSHIGAQNTLAMYGAVWASGTCKHPTDPNVPPETSTGKYVSGGIAQAADGYRNAELQVSCSQLGIIKSPAWQPTQVTVQPLTTKQKLTSGLTESYQHWTKLNWSDKVVAWQSPSYAPGNAQYRAEVTCKNITTGVRQVITASTDVNAAGSVNVPACATLGSGWYPEAMVVGFADGDTLKQPIFTATPAEPDQYFECDPAFGKSCKFEIWIDGKPCVIGSPACASWAGLFKVAPGRVVCMYGGKQVDMSGCAILEGAYIYGGTPAIKPNTDGNPDTWQDPGTVPGWTPHILPAPDPVTNPDPSPIPDPNPQPQTPPNPNPAPDITTNPNPNPSPSPSPSASPSPGTGTNPIPTTGVNPNTNPGGENCLGAMWTWNPIDWVMVPVQCALTWAFVPNTATLQAKGDQIYQKFNDIGITGPIDALTGSFDSLPGGGGCAGPTVQFDIESVHQTIQPFNACDQPMAGIAAAANAFGSVYLLVFGSIGVVRTISGAFGYTFSMGAKE